MTKSDGNTPAQSYIRAMPEWKREIGHRLDELIVHVIPNVRKAISWNTPFFGIEGQDWFVAFDCAT